MSGDNITALTCNECAATVAEMAAGRHREWHRTLITDDILVKLLEDLTNRQRYNG